MKNLTKTIIIFTVDMTCLLMSVVMAYLFRFDFTVLHKIHVAHALHVASLLLLVFGVLFFVFKLHRVIWRYASINEMVLLCAFVSVGFVVVATIALFLFGVHYIPLSILPLQAFFYLALLVFTRGLYRIYRGIQSENVVSKNVLIIGAGRAAEGLIRDMLNNPERGYKPVGLLDDDRGLQHRAMHGVRVLGVIDSLEDVIKQFELDMVLVAIPSLSDNALMNRVYNICSREQLPVRVLPGLNHLADGRVSIDALREVSIEDLLGREPVSLLDNNLVTRFFEKTVMVTGGGGSIGSELCRQIATNRPAKLIVIDNNEFNLFEIEREIKKRFPVLILEALLLDVANLQELGRALAVTKPHILFHAAAFKHVPMLEYQVFSAVKNNVLATRQLADLADQYGVENFILVSTDKAVNPTNIMGMSKRIGEIYCQNKNKRSKTNYSTVRFGNVLGSAGSVLPLFREQLAKGGPLTVTDPNMTRYFMMIPEAVSLILQAFLIGQGGEIFVLDMGEPVKIVDLAEKLITLSGKVPYKQVDIQFTGIRPGEKLFEELFYDAEHLKQTSLQKVFESHTREYNWNTLIASFDSLQQSYQHHRRDALLSAMLSLVPEYSGTHKEAQRSTETV